MSEYLRALEPVLSHQQHERTKAIVKQFTSPSGLGPILYQYLVDKRDAEDNWVNIFYGGFTRADYGMMINNNLMNESDNEKNENTESIFVFFLFC